MNYTAGQVIELARAYAGYMAIRIGDLEKISEIEEAQIAADRLGRVQQKIGIYMVDAGKLTTIISKLERLKAA